MTIKTRNTAILFITFFSLCLILSAGLLTGLKLSSGSFVFPPNPRAYGAHTFMQDFILTQFHFLPVALSVFVFTVYVFVSLLYVYVEFEKTQSTEVVYFSLFLIGCSLEAARLLFPLLDLWQRVSSVAVLSSRIVIFARTLAPLSLLFASVYSSSEYRQYTEQNVLILFIAALSLAMFAPLNTAEILPVCRIKTGYEPMFKTVQFLILGIAVAAHITKSAVSGKQKKLPAAVVLISAGYVILCSADNYIALAAGSAALISGTFLYLKNLHNKYLWQA
ncbi:MAG: hypothetical protein ACTTKL_03610 [Treponema sp.]